MTAFNGRPHFALEWGLRFSLELYSFLWSALMKRRLMKASHPQLGTLGPYAALPPIGCLLMLAIQSGFLHRLTAPQLRSQAQAGTAVIPAYRRIRGQFMAELKSSARHPSEQAAKQWSSLSR
ncbi:hypothetical protein NQZ68_024641 [Dissostichus eleginoides]|nr:hypothetical protein NQZ68_024641 [Dissostichus eleginoides]